MDANAKQAAEQAIRDVLAERVRQDEKWGEQNHDPQTYLSILTEELGETAKEANDLRWWHPKAAGVGCAYCGAAEGHRDNIKARLYDEAVQTAAVALAMVECLIRDKWRWPEQQRERVEFAEIIVRLKQRGVITEEDVERLERDGLKEVAHGG